MIYKSYILNRMNFYDFFCIFYCYIYRRVKCARNLLYHNIPSLLFLFGLSELNLTECYYDRQQILVSYDCIASFVYRYLFIKALSIKHYLHSSWVFMFFRFGIYVFQICFSYLLWFFTSFDLCLFVFFLSLVIVLGICFCVQFFVQFLGCLN